MSRYPAAIWSGPIPNMTARGMGTVLGVCLHIMEGTLAGTDSWFHNPKAQASAHFGVGKDGTVRQWVDTTDKAWAEVAGNGQYVSIEHEGNTGDSLTPAQIKADAALVSWLHGLYGFPLQLANKPGDHGLGYHAMGGQAWGGHSQCPGAPIIAQRQQILDAITKPSPTPSPPVQEDDDMPGLIAQAKGDTRVYLVNPAIGTKIYCPTQAVINWYVFLGAKAQQPGNKPFTGQDPAVWASLHDLTPAAK